MGGMPSTNAPGYAPQPSPAPAAGGKMPASQSQYGPPQQGARRAGSVGQQRMADAIHRMLPADGRGAFVGQERMADAMRSMIPASSQGPGGYGTQQQAVAPGTNGAGIPPDVLSNYNAQTAGQQGQAAPFQTQQMLNNVQQGTGALGQMGQQGYPQPGAQIMGGTVTPQTYTGQQAQTGYQAPSSDMSQLYGQFNQAQGMGQGQQQQSYGSQSAGQPSGGFMSGTGGGTTGGGGMSRGKGFRSGGAVNNIRLSNDDVKRILNALATAREVVKNGK